MAFLLERDGLDRLFEALKAQGYQLVGPTPREGAIIFDTIDSVKDLPQGLTDAQDGGTYRLKKRPDAALFGYAVGPHSWKKFLHPPVRKLWSLDRKGKSFEIAKSREAIPRYAFIGVRSCDLHAIEIQDRVFIKDQHQDPSYVKRRGEAFIVVVQCGVAGGTCFCVSMKTGPKAETGYDLAMTEVLEGDRHYFVLEAGSERGRKILDAISPTEADASQVQAAQGVVEETARHMGRQMDTREIKELLYSNYQHPRWGDVADRCLTCANCTMVCPTCFCTTVEDVTDLTGDHTERWQKWDSCFTMDFTYLNGGGSVRASTRARYRQWMTHKLATWFDQFGSSGCVGCGRCITWCPVAIDITEEVAAIRKDQK